MDPPEWNTMIVFVTDMIAETVDTTETEMLGAMIDAQNVYGQITWTDLGENIAKGTFDGDHRVAVIDLDKSGVAGIRAALWVRDGAHE